jgi:fructose-1,6-bisphosphatase/inositol monophosphatase family enzyme
MQANYYLSTWCANVRCAAAGGTMAEVEALRRLLCALGDAVRDRVVTHRARNGTASLATVVGQVAADVIYAVDRVGEDLVLDWLDRHWPADEPVRLVMEGVEDDRVVTVPASAGAPRWVLIVDPVDGTRNLMVDKRPAWVLTALAPADGEGSARLPAVEVAAMTEIPTTRQWRADQVSAVRGHGPAGVRARALDVRTGDRHRLVPAPSAAATLDHGFASFAHFLPDGKALLASVEQRLWDELMPPGPEPRQIFEDQYLCSGGQLYEVLAGRDRLVGDLRPLALARLGLPVALTAHPYDVCTALVLTEAGGVVEDPRGGPVDVPLDTTSPVTWVAYANERLAALVRPALARLIKELL